MTSLPDREIDRAWRLALALSCGDEGGAEALVEEGARRAVAIGEAPGCEPGRLIRGVALTFMKRTREAARTPDPGWEGPTPEVGDAGHRRASLAILSALEPPLRLAVVLRHLEGLTSAAVAAWTGWGVGEAKDLERRGLARVMEEATERARLQLRVGAGATA